MLAVAAAFAAIAQAAPGRAEASDAAHERQVVRSLQAEARLKPRRVECHEGRCRWKASKRSAGWTYTCSGRARRASRGWKLTPCRLKPPKLAPLKKHGRNLRAFGYNDLSIFVERQISLAPGAGADSMRVILYWNLIEQAPGSFRWGTYDGLYKRMLQLGMRPLFIVLGTPCWAAASAPECESHFTSMPPADDAYDDYARFAAKAAARYPQAVGFEVWNEPNIEQFWWPGPDPARYARLLKLTHDEVKASAPATTVVSAGLFPVGHDISGIQMRDTRFLGKVYEAEGTEIADAIGSHPYPGGKRKRHLRDVRLRIARVRGTMARFGDQAKPVWVTEVGLSTTGPEEQRYGEHQQADRLVELYRMLRRVPGSPVVYIHTFFDLAGSLEDQWNGMGIVRADRETLKPAYCALADARGLTC